MRPTCPTPTACDLQEKKLLVDNTLLLTGNIVLDGTGNVHSLAATARVYSVDGAGCVDVHHSFANKQRCGTGHRKGAGWVQTVAWADVDRT